MTDPTSRKFDFSWGALAKVALAAILVWAWLKLWPLALVLLVAIVLAVTFDPPVSWLERHKFPRWLSVLVLGALLLGASGVFIYIIFPPLIAQGKHLLESGKGLQAALDRVVPQAFRETVKEQLEQLMTPPADAAGAKNPVVVAGSMLLSAMTIFVFGFALTLYLVAEGRRVYAWLVAFVPRALRPRVQQTTSEVSKVVFAYVAGQVITSAICAVYAYAVLKALHVPAALVLASLAGVFDILPIAGFVIAVVPAMVMALTVSSATMVWVVLAYMLYHALENYLIVPKVYGNRLRLSTLAVLIALAIGGELAGIVGAILVLPLVAAYPIIERLWLAKHVGEEAVVDHQALDDEPPKAIVQQVIAGEIPSGPKR